GAHEPPRPAAAVAEVVADVAVEPAEGEADRQQEEQVAADDAVFDQVVHARLPMVWCIRGRYTAATSPSAAAPSPAGAGSTWAWHTSSTRISRRTWSGVTSSGAPSRRVA